MYNFIIIIDLCAEESRQDSDKLMISYDSLSHSEKNHTLKFATEYNLSLLQSVNKLQQEWRRFPCLFMDETETLRKVKQHEKE